MGLLSSFEKVWDKALGNNTTQSPSPTFKTEKVKRSLLSDPSMSMLSGESVDTIGNVRGSGYIGDSGQNDNYKAMLAVDEQRAKLQKQVGKQGTSILGGGLY